MSPGELSEDVLRSEFGLNALCPNPPQADRRALLWTARSLRAAPGCKASVRTVSAPNGIRPEPRRFRTVSIPNGGWHGTFAAQQSGFRTRSFGPGGIPQSERSKRAPSLQTTVAIVSWSLQSFGQPFRRRAKYTGPGLYRSWLEGRQARTATRLRSPT